MLRLYDIINEVIAPITTTPSWNARSGYGSFLTMEFGNPSMMVGRPIRGDHVDRDLSKPLLRRRVHVRGQWHLWIYLCAWRCMHHGQEAGHSALHSTSKRPIQAAAYALNGQILTSVTVDPSHGTSAFQFDLGGSLNTQPYRPDSVQWLLYRDNGMVFSYRSDGMYCHKPGNVSASGSDWMHFT